MSKTQEKKRKIIVTGGAGFIGSHLSRRLIEKGFEVHIVDNFFTGKKENIPTGAIVHAVDIRDMNKVDKVFRSISSIYAVFHCAAIPMVQFSIDNPLESHEVNVDGIHNILILSVKYKARKFIYSASCSVYGDQDELPLREEMSPAPKSPYALQKYFGEQACKTYSKVYGIKTVSLRYFNVYGLGQDPNGNYAMLIAKFINQSKNKKPMTITGSGRQTRDFIYVSDVVDANMRALKSKKVGNGEIINIGSGVNTSVNEIASIIGGKKKYIAKRLEPKHALADIGKARSLLGWQPKIDIKTGINLIKNYK